VTMPERLLILALISAAVVVAAAATRAWSRQRVTRLQGESGTSAWDALGQQPDGRAGLLVFSTPFCVACRTTQEPAIQAVGAEYGASLRVVHVDIGARPDAARAFSILTAPSTVVLRPDGRVSAVNQGVASAARLRSQLTVAAASPA